MGIKNRDAYRDAAWDWDWLKGCFGSGLIRPSDIDGVVERHGAFLFLEAKPAGKEIGMGQRILLEALARLPQVTVLILWGEPEKPGEMEVIGRKRVQCDRDDVIAFCRHWFDRANLT